MPKWICDDCGAHYPLGFSFCKKCAAKEQGQVTFEFPIKTMELDEWIKSKAGMTIQTIKVGEDVLLKCKEDLEYYLL